jgi:hypothetical protein
MAIRLVEGPHHREWPKRNGEQHAAPSSNRNSIGLGVPTIPGDLARQTSEKEDDSECCREQDDQDDEGEDLEGHAATNVE